MEEIEKIEFSETNRGKKQLIINKKYKFNFSLKKKDNSKVYRCTEYKTANKCKSFIILNDKNEILKYESFHNHLEKEFDASLSLIKHKIKEEIRKSIIPMDLKPRRIYNEVSQNMGFICPEYDTIRSQILRNINKQIHTDITTFDEIPNELIYYKTERGEDFMIFKNPNIIIFQSPFQAKLFSKYYEDIFADGTFYVAPKFSYQVFITRTYVSELNKFYTTSISILKNKKEATYETLFKEIIKNVNKFRENSITTQINLHCDFEIAISNAARKIIPNLNIKYCVWHYKKSLEKQKNILCFNEVDNNNDVYVYYKAISNLPFINPEYIFDIYFKIKKESLSYNDYERRINGIWRKKQKIIRKTDEIKNIIENYKYMEKDYIYNGYDRKDIVELWYNCLIDLNNKKCFISNNSYITFDCMLAFSLPNFNINKNNDINVAIRLFKENLKTISKSSEDYIEPNKPDGNPLDDAYFYYKKRYLGVGEEKFFKYITVEKIKYKISKLSSNKASGLDDGMKHFIFPIPKKEKTNYIQDFRPISITNIFRKIFEILLLTYIYKKLNNKFKLCCKQAGFRRGYSTITHAIVSYATCYENNFNIFLDIKKAYDSVPIGKLKIYRNKNEFVNVSSNDDKSNITKNENNKEILNMDYPNNKVKGKQLKKNKRVNSNMNIKNNKLDCFCIICNKVFNRKYDLERQKKTFRYKAL
ncbi:hypothetical protein BCR32DRAFT_284173 [Anaeromyces robustus]|uniref:Reverse transcriptase domain-containing protein n=1 Tax=Anaeromyces robustus TaxID=1754192 RepID=A0A1Y1WTE2_9FUNG|nr:hypothetical protein BCR32DRAFT_284173 [Anaeromyces robustus]|eukprot:ORX76414.1 hypothetical protein BCR32DRAFT_284173 [Anaeromyces robustus]